MQWSTAADLPQPMCLASATVCGDHLYVLCGTDENRHDTKLVFMCLVSDLLQSCVPSKSRSAKLKRCEATVWRQVANLPVTCSTCVSFHCRLLAVGGMTDSQEFTTAVYMYDSTTDSWEIVSHMTNSRYRCFTAVLPDNQLMVMGGWIAGYSETDTIELANVCN